MTAYKSLDDMTEPELSELLVRVAKRLTAMLPPDTGFLVLAAPLGEPGHRGIAQYVSNVTRESAADWMREALERWDDGQFLERSGA